MKFLVDAQLPPRLSDWLTSKGHNSRHVKELQDGLTAADTDIWNIAKSNNQIVVTKDTDFFEISLLFGAPPQLLHIAVGNTSNNDLISILDRNFPHIESALKESARIVSVTLNHIRVFE